MIALHLSEPTIPTITLIEKKYSCLEKIKNKEAKSCFQKKKVLLSTRQPPNLSKLLFIVKFERLPIRKQIKPVGFPLCKKKIVLIFFVKI